MASHSFDPEFVEVVVREVMRRLLERGVAVESDERPSERAPQELVLDDRLVTLARLERRLDGVRRVVVPQRAVVTPAVRDELKDHKIELVRR